MHHESACYQTANGADVTRYVPTAPLGLRAMQGVAARMIAMEQGQITRQEPLAAIPGGLRLHVAGCRISLIDLYPNGSMDVHVPRQETS